MRERERGRVEPRKCQGDIREPRAHPARDTRYACVRTRIYLCACARARENEKERQTVSGAVPREKKGSRKTSGDVAAIPVVMVVVVLLLVVVYSRREKTGKTEEREKERERGARSRN